LGMGFGLVYYADAEAEPDLLMIHPVRWQSVKKPIRTWVREIAGS